MHVQIEQVIIPSRKNDKPYSDYGFVHFKNRTSAVKLVEECEASENPRRLEYPAESGTFLQVHLPICTFMVLVLCMLHKVARFGPLQHHLCVLCGHGSMAAA